MTTQTVFSRDLAGIEVGETAISEVRGDEGVLTYRGHPIDKLVEFPFWQVVWLVVFGQWPDRNQENSLREFMARHARLTAGEKKLLLALPESLHPMLMLQGVVPALKLEPQSVLPGVSPVAHAGLMIAAKLPSLVAAWRQMELKNDVIEADVDLAFHENFLKMFNGRLPSAEEVAVLDATQILQMEHSFNAGTFAGRVCASTKAPIQSSVSASIGTLYGVLHGGADQAALEMAERIGTPGKAQSFVNDLLGRKEKIMGMGHREYRVVDPRARILKPMAEELCREGDAKRLFDTLVAVEEACQNVFEKKGKDIRANVEFYKGAVFYTLGIPPMYFTSVFAMARVYGYIAHYLEFSENSALIRPRARYTGS